MKGTSKTFEILLIGLVVSILVAVGLIAFGILNTDSVKKYIAGEGPKVLSSGEFSRQYTFCELNCDPFTKKTCTKRLCEKDKTCTTKSGKIIDPTCAEVYGMADNYKPPATTGGTIAEAASFEGAFLPGGTVKIVLPEAMKAEFDATKFAVEITEEGSAMSIPCDAVKSSTDNTKCRKDFLNKDSLVIILPYKRDAQNDEKIIKKDAKYTITAYLSKMPPSKIAGTKQFSWSCPQPAESANSLYEPKQAVEFSFSSSYDWVDYGKYDGTNAKVEIGIRKGTTGYGCYDSGWVPTCFVPLQPKSVPPSTSHKNYWFEMPYIFSGKPTAISYPVYAKNKDSTAIDIKSGGSSVPMCRSGKEITWACPESACFIGTGAEAGKEYVLSVYDASGTYSSNPACKYSARDECSSGCRAVPGAKTAECVYPKPDIVKIFMRTKKGTSIVDEYEFKDEKYTVNPSFLLAQDNYDVKSAVVVLQNNAPSSQTAKSPDIKAGDITVTASIDSSSRPVIRTVYRQRQKDTTTGKYVWVANPSMWVDNPSTLSDATLVRPGDYLEYEVDLSGVGDSIGTHSGLAGIDPPATVKVASDSRLSSAYSYKIIDKCCNGCSMCNQGKCSTCGEKICVWDAVSASEAFCKAAK